jgi:diaminopimelate decarboxylase
MTHPSDRYRDAIQAAWGSLRLWDYLRYDEAGDLWLNGLRVLDAARRYGTPLEIVDTTVIERRCREFRALAAAAAEAAGYPGRLDFLYAAKANMASEVVSAAYRSGWHAETSAAQDLHNLVWLRQRGLLPAGLRVVCNGFKLAPERLARPTGEASAAPGAAPGADLGPLLPPAPRPAPASPASYAETIVALAGAGWAITPILDAEELPFFLRPGTPPMSVGLRLKFGPVGSPSALEAHVSRFGQSWPALRSTARQVAASPHLTLTTLHAMVGAAETIPVPRLVDSLAFAARLWAELRAELPSLSELNLGGGLPPLGEDYDHAGFLAALFAAVRAEAAARGVPAPDLTFELGSLVATEGGCHVFRVLQWKRNHADEATGPDDWAIVDGGLMAAIPDMLFLDKPFRFLAVTGANRPPRPVRIGDITCDSDGRYPPKALGPAAAVLLPAGEGEQYVLIQGVGAYQEILSGVRGAHHCGLLEAVELILEPAPDGTVHGRLVRRQTAEEAAMMLGYGEDAVASLAAAAAHARAAAP